jgi:hypothetical protein
MAGARFLAEVSFFLLHSVEIDPGAIQPSIQWVREALSPEGIKRPGREADHSPPSRAAVKSGGDMPPFPHAYSQHCTYFIKHSDNVIFFFCEKSVVEEDHDHV